MALSEWINKQTVVHPYHGIPWNTMEYYGILLSNKERYLLIHVITWMNLKEIMLSEDANLKRFNIVWFNLHNLKWQNYRNGEQISDCWGLGIGKEWVMGNRWVVIKEWRERSLWWWNCSVSSIWWWVQEPTNSYLCI